MKPKQRISESFYMKLAKLLLGPKYSKSLDKYESDLKDNAEFRVLMSDIEKKQQELQDTIRNHCKRYPDSALCKKK